MRRSVLLTVAVHCPHLNRTVAAQRNDMIGRLVHCSTGDTCRQTLEPAAADVSNRPYPAGCPVYPSLAKSA